MKRTILYTKTNLTHTLLKSLSKSFSNKANPLYYSSRFFNEDNNNTDQYKPRNKDEMNFEVYDTKVTEVFTPSKPLVFVNGKYTVFEYKEPTPDETGFIKLPQVPYEIKEHAVKGFVYTFMLTMVNRLISTINHFYLSYNFVTFIPAAVFAYHFLRPLYLMYNAVIKVELLEDGETIRLTYKNKSSTRDVKIGQLIKKEKENIFVECYTEPFLFPLQINNSKYTGKFSLRSHKRFYLYGDSHETIKNGEVLRAIINNQNISI